MMDFLIVDSDRIVVWSKRKELMTRIAPPPKQILNCIKLCAFPVAAWDFGLRGCGRYDSTCTYVCKQRSTFIWSIQHLSSTRAQ